MSGYDLIAHAGNAEDVVLMRTFAGPRGGFFVDVGAGEPVSGSLTKNLVDGLGWRRVNVEPLPERHARLRQSRPGDINLRVAVGDEPGTATFFRIVPGRGKTGGGLGTLRRDVLEGAYRGRLAAGGVARLCRAARTLARADAISCTSTRTRTGWSPARSAWRPRGASATGSQKPPPPHDPPAPVGRPVALRGYRQPPARLRD